MYNEKFLFARLSKFDIFHLISDYTETEFHIISMG